MPCGVCHGEDGDGMERVAQLMTGDIIRHYFCEKCRTITEAIEKINHVQTLDYTSFKLRFARFKQGFNYEGEIIEGSGSGSSSDSGSDSDPNSEPHSNQVGARVGRGDAKEYPDDFERLWAGCTGRRGNKYPAFKAWRKVKPDVELCVKRWSMWMTTTDFKLGFIPHLSTWLNERGWENEPGPDEFKPRANQETFQQRQERQRAEAKERERASYEMRQKLEADRSAKMRAAAEKAATPAELQRAREESGSVAVGRGQLGAKAVG